MKRIVFGSVLLASAAAAVSGEAPRSVEHVLLISVDGIHQQDLDKCIAAKTCRKIAKLASHGVIYTNAYTPGLSDSVPGLAALVTGGSPRSLRSCRTYSSTRIDRESDCGGPRMRLASTLSFGPSASLKNVCLRDFC